MPRPSIALEVIDIANPCPAEWDDMRGDERVRFCKHCSLHVYNLSGMTRDAAEQIVAEHDGRLCVRFYRRDDGTVITQDCENAWKQAARRVRRWAAAGMAFALWAVLAPLGLSRLANASSSEKCASPATVQPAPTPRALMGDFAMPPQPVLMGKIAPPATQPAKMGQMAPLMGVVAVPLPPTSKPAATQPAN